MTINNKLTPAQIKFCSENIDGFAGENTLIELAGSAASGRKFWRIKPEGRNSVILVVWSSDDSEWNYFLSIANEIDRGFFPEIFKFSRKDGLILEEDLGKNTLKKAVMSALHEDAVKKLYCSVIDKLVEWQDMNTENMGSLKSRVLNRDIFLWESDYFSKYLVKQYLGIGSTLDSSWETERKLLADTLAGYPLVPLHRDFQSENIIVTENYGVRFVDFQGARVGPLEYDLASLFFDPYIASDISFVMDLFNYYVSSSGHSTSYKSLCLAGAQRLMQALGAYANLSLNKGKEQYRSFIPVALTTLLEITSDIDELKTLNKIVDRCRAELG